MGSSKYIGRVGALAVALGIGTALASGTGIAQADTGNHHGKSGDRHSSSTTHSAGPKASAAKSSAPKAAASTKPTRQSPLSKISDQVRKDVKSNLDNVANALKHAPGQVTKPQTKIAGVRSKTTKKAPDSAATVPDAVSTASSRTQRPAPVKLNDVTERLTAPITKALDEAVAQKPAARLENVAAALSNAAPLHVETVAPKVTAVPVVSTLLAGAGLSPFAAGSNPTAPSPSPALWGLMAWARRETARTINPNGISLVSAKDASSVVAEGDVQPMAAAVGANTASTDPNASAAKPAAPVVGNTNALGWLTGPASENGSWFVSGTDLGIMWDSGYTDPETGKPLIYTLFGDTYSEPGMGGDWRNNVLFRSSDGQDFLQAVISPGGNYNQNVWWGPGSAYDDNRGDGPFGASQIIRDPGYNGLLGTTYTMIPTSAIAVHDDPMAEGGTTQYATVMSVRTWDNPGSWTTNYSAIAYSKDGGKTWTVDPDTVRASGFLRSSEGYVAGNQNFQQNALVYGNPEDSASYVNGVDGERYIYVYGTPSGRQGSAYVARVAEGDITNLDNYEYWSGDDNGWVKGDPSAATSVIGGGDSNYLPLLPKTGFLGTISKGIAGFVNGIWVGGIPTGGNVSEMSVQYNEYLGQYVVLYTDGGNNVVMRVSDTPQGEWSDASTLIANNGSRDTVLGTAHSGMYAPMINPLSGTDAMGAGNEQYLYYNLSYWGEYNVATERTDLSPMKPTTQP